jgi:hypothetical protein
MTAPVEKHAALRIGIIVESFVQPQWVRRALEKILATGVASLELIVEVPPEKSSSKSFLHNLYNRMDTALFPPSPDALEPVSIKDLVGSAPSLSMNELGKIKTFELDVLVNFGSTKLNAKFADAAKYGVWFYVFGTNESDEPGFRELLTQDSITITSLRSLNGQPSKERVIYQSVSPTLSRFSVGLNNNQCYWKSAAFVARGLVNLYHGQNSIAAGISTRADSAVAVPTNAATAQMFLQLAGRAATRFVEKRFEFEQWVLAYRLNGTEFKYLMPSAERFWADPFPIQVAGKYYIFFEEYLNSAGKAHISVIGVDKGGIVNGPTEVLKMECHLSYPFVFEWQGDCYMVPETGSKNAVELYRSTSFPFEWKLEQVLLEANHPLDATLVEVEGVWWMFVNIQEDGVKVNWDELHLYYADNPRGPWKPHLRNPIVSDVRSARPAGWLYWSKNTLYRPSQDSSLRYGYATTINRIDKLSQTEYSETEVGKILPNWDKDVIGIHTLNRFNEITVIDCLLKRKRFRKGMGYAPPGLLADLPT